MPSCMNESNTLGHATCYVVSCNTDLPLTDCRILPLKHPGWKYSQLSFYRWKFLIFSSVTIFGQLSTGDREIRPIWQLLSINLKSWQATNPYTCETSCQILSNDGFVYHK